MMVGPIKLTKKQRNILVAAERVIIEVLDREGEVLMTSFHQGWTGVSATYFAPSGTQYGDLWTGTGCTLADKIECALEHRFNEEGRAEFAKADRIERLKRELAALTGEAT